MFVYLHVYACIYIPSYMYLLLHALQSNKWSNCTCCCMHYIHSFIYMLAYSCIYIPSYIYLLLHAWQSNKWSNCTWQTIVTGAGDETLRFWNVFPSAKTPVSMVKTLSSSARSLSLSSFEPYFIKAVVGCGFTWLTYQILHSNQVYYFRRLFVIPEFGL